MLYHMHERVQPWTVKQIHDFPSSSQRIEDQTVDLAFLRDWIRPWPFGSGHLLSRSLCSCGSNTQGSQRLQCTSSHKTSPMRATAFASNSSQYVEPWFTCRSSSCFEADGCARRRREKLWRSHGLMPHSIFSTRFTSIDQTRDGISANMLAIEAGTRSASFSHRS